MQHLANILYKTIPREGLVSSFLNNVVCTPSETSFSQASTLLKFSAPCSSLSQVAYNGPKVQSRIAGAKNPVSSSHQGVCFLSKSLAQMLPMVQVVVIMGVSGAGKSTVGNLLAEALNCPFLDADDFHPHANKEKMSKGIPLTDEDRMPWLQVLCRALKEYVTCGKRAVLACSALRNMYREILRSSDPSYISGGHCKSVRFVLLDVPVEVLSDRLNKRMANGQHFMPPTLLKSQLDLLEIDASEGVLRVDATQSPSLIVDIVQAAVS